MGEEIKEILDRLDFNEWEVDLYKVPITWCELYDIRDYITSLQQKVEQLEKENQKFFEELNTCMIERNSFLDKVEQLEKENKELRQPQVFIDCEDMEERYGRDLYEDYLKGKIEQLENIRKEAIEYMDRRDLEWGSDEHTTLLNILNKGSDKE